MTPPELSVVVTVVEGGNSLRRCLDALLRQSEPPSLEIIVPFDDSTSEVVHLEASFPAVRFLSLGPLRTEDAPLTPYTRHVLYDRCRSAGLLSSTGSLVAMTEDRCTPAPTWARNMVDLHRGGEFAAIGGAVENGSTGTVRWAIFFCDFGRFQPPVEQDNPEYITDINICYRRDALESIRAVWESRYQEPQVNWALRNKGLHLYLSQRPIVVQERKTVQLLSVLDERIQFGRIFGELRARGSSPLKCLAWASLTPIVPTMLFIRHFRRQIGKRRHLQEFLFAVPATLLLLHAWVAGEFLGYCDAALAGLRPSLRKSSSPDAGAAG